MKYLERFVNEEETNYSPISDDYHITEDELRSDVKLPFILTRLLFMLIAVTSNIALVYFLLATRYDLLGLIEYEIAASIVAGLSIFILGLIGGRFWIGIGYRISRATYNVYLVEDKGFFQKIFAYFYRKFTEPDSRIYLEAKAKDPRLNNPLNLFQLIINISISQLSFFMVGTAFLARPVIQLLRDFLPDNNILLINESNQLIVQNIAAMGIAVIVMAFYIPMNYIMTDSNIRTWNLKDMKIGTPSQKIRSRVDGLIGLGAIITGWSIYSDETSGGIDRFALNDFNWIVQGYDLATYLDYVIWLAALLILAWPLIVPASIYYFTNHGKTVNKFRAEASRRGVPIGVTKVRHPTSEEAKIIREFQEHQLDNKKKEETKISEDNDPLLTDG